jgi:hypothetical protein
MLVSSSLAIFNVVLKKITPEKSVDNYTIISITTTSFGVIQ